MHNWKHINTTYIYDGSFDGLLCIVFDSYINKTIPENIVCNDYCINLFNTYKKITTDYEKSKRIYNGIVKNVSYKTLYYSYNVFLSNEMNKEILILNYLLLGFEIGNKIDHLLSNPIVLDIQKISKRVLNECHRFKGLTRFIKISNNLFYSKIHPDNNIIEYLGNHFIKRLPNENFIIHDKIRNIAFLYNTSTYIIVEAENLEINSMSEDEIYFQNLWKCFYNTISIKERKNPRLQMQYMPKKYWQDLIEKQITIN